MRIARIIVLMLCLLLLAVPGLAAESRLSSGTTTDGFGYEIVSRDGDVFARLTGYSGTLYGPQAPSYIQGYRVLEIGEGAFSGNTRLTEFIIPSTVKTIGARAFEDCIGLVMVKMPSSVKEIGESAFEGCTNLGAADVTLYDFALGSGVETIGKNAFAACAYLPKITIPASVREIGEGAFSMCLRLAEVTFLTGVTSVGDTAFAFCTSLERVDLPTSVTKIGHGAFMSCTALESVTLRSMGETGMYAFSGCTALSEVTIGAGIATVTEGAFNGCTALDSILIPPTVTTVEAYAVPAQTQIRGVAGSAAQTYAKENGNAFTAVSQTDFPNLVGDYVFSGTVLTGYMGEGGDLVIPYGTSAIHNDVFSGNAAVTSVVIPDGVGVIGANVFKNCTNLTSVTLPRSLTAIGDSAFGGCSRLTVLTLPDEIVTLGASVFYSRTAIECDPQSETAITLGASGLAFYAPADATATYTARREADGTRVVTLVGLSLGTKTDVEIPEGVTEIGGLFSGNTSITSVSFPSTLKIVGTKAFYQCTALKEIAFSDGLETIGESAFESCTALASVSVPGSLKTIGASAFAYCSSLDSILLPDYVTFIGSYAFYKSSGVTILPLCSVVSETGLAVSNMGTGWTYSTPGYESIRLLARKDESGRITVSATSTDSTAAQIVIPEGVTHLPMNAISYNYQLTSVVLPQSLTTMDYACIKNCTKLKSVTLPDSLVSMDEYAIYGIYPAPKLYCRPDSETAFMLTAESRSFYTPGNDQVKVQTTKDENGELVVAAVDCEYSATDIVIPEGVTIIAEGAFSSKSNLVSVVVSEGVREIGQSAFSWCTSLESVTLPQSLRVIAYDAFGYLSSLASITLPDHIDSIASNAFYSTSAVRWCNPFSETAVAMAQAGYKFSALSHEYLTVKAEKDESGANLFTITDCDTSVTQVDIPEGVTAIGASAFSGCVLLERIALPQSVTALGASAFSGCTALTDVSLPEGLTEIAGSTFSGCAALMEIDLPDAVTKIGSYAFHNCASLEAIPLPDGLSSIDGYAFSGCAALEEIALPDNVTSINRYAFSGCGAALRCTLLSRTAVALTSAEYAVRDPDAPLLELSIHGGEEEGYYAVLTGCDASAVEITVPQYVTQLGAYAFEGCALLEKITLHDNITSVGQSAFSGCEAVKYCSLNSQTADALGNAFDGTFVDSAYPLLTFDSFTGSDGVNIVHYFSVVDCDASAVHVDVPQEIESIENGAFRDCALLQSITLPDTLTKIGNSAFDGCASLKEITIPASVASFDGCVLANCTALTKATILADVATLGGRAFYGCTALTEVILPAGLTQMDTGEFYGCASLERIVLPDGIGKIGSDVFYRCKAKLICGMNSETALTLSAYGKGFNVETAPQLSLKAAKGTDGARMVTVTACDKDAEEIGVPEGVSVIGGGAFQNCSRLRNVLLPDSLTSIGSSAFIGCTSLRQLTIPKGVASMTSSVAGYMEYVTLPKELTQISGSVFGSSLHTVFCYRDSAADAWAQEQGYAIVYLDGGTPESYTTLVGVGDVNLAVGTAYGWANRLMAVPQPAGKCTLTCVSSDPQTVRVDDGCVTFLKSGEATLVFSIEEMPGVTLSVRAAGYERPQGFTLPASLTTIEEGAFMGLTAAGVVLPEGTKTLRGNAFANCRQLTGIYIPESTTSISYNTFSGCDQLKIFGAEGSYAQRYAESYGIEFVIAQ